MEVLRRLSILYSLIIKYVWFHWNVKVKSRLGSTRKPDHVVYWKRIARRIKKSLVRCHSGIPVWSIDVRSLQFPKLPDIAQLSHM